MRLIHILCSLSLFLLFACGEEKEFMTPKPGEIILDVNVDEYSLNGNVLGKTFADIFNNDNLLIKSLDKELKRIRRNELKETKENNLSSKELLVKLHFDEDLSFDEFNKVAATFGFSGFTSIQYVIGSNFKEIHTLFLSKRNDECRQAKSAGVTRLLKRYSGNTDLSNEDVWKQRIKEKAILIECARKYIDLSLTFETIDNKWVYTVGLNETGLTDGNKLYQFENDTDVYKFIEGVRQRRSLNDKEDRDKILLALRKNVLLKDIAPIIKKLTSYGYRINFALVGS